MPNYVGLAKSAAGVLRTNWPRIQKAWTFASVYLQEHPDLSAAVRQRVERYRGRLVDARNKKGEEAQIRAMLDVVVSASTTPGADDAVRAGLANQAERLGQALGVAEQLSGRERRQALVRIRTKTDALAAEAIESLLPDDARPGSPSA